jgi:hypothetical protein
MNSFSINFGWNTTINAGIMRMAPIRQAPIEISTRYPKNLIEVNPDSISTENPAMTLTALIIMLLPIVFIAAIVASEWDKPFLKFELKHHTY